MGQYHKLFNLDKKQFVHAHRIDNGLKLMEQCGFEKSTSTALWLLVAASGGSRGGGDARAHDLIGSWAGDRIAVIGDYSEPEDLPNVDVRATYSEDGYEDISARVKQMLDAEFA